MRAACDARAARAAHACPARLECDNRNLYARLGVALAGRTPFIYRSRTSDVHKHSIIVTYLLSMPALCRFRPQRAVSSHSAGPQGAPLLWEGAHASRQSVSHSRLPAATCSSEEIGAVERARLRAVGRGISGWSAFSGEHCRRRHAHREQLESGSCAPS